MINGFNNETQPLTDYERDTLLPVMIAGLRHKIGRSMAVTNKYILQRLKPLYKISDARVRKLINHIRVNGLVPCLIATSDGYYIAQSEQELADYEQSLLSREQAIRAVRLAIDRQRKEKYSCSEPTLFD